MVREFLWPLVMALPCLAPSPVGGARRAGAGPGLAAAAVLAAALLGMGACEADAQPSGPVGPADLAEAVAASPSGGVIELAGVDWGAFNLSGFEWPDGRPLVLRAADPSDPPRFSRFVVQDVRNVVLEGLLFDYEFAAGDPPWTNPFRIIDSREVTIRGSRFEGDVARGVSAAEDGFGTGYGLNVRFSDDVTLEGSSISGFLRGLVVDHSRDVVVRRNDLHGLRSEGMNFAQVEGLLVEGNHIHDFDIALASGDHADMIQFWTAGTEAPSRDVVIRGNLLNSGGGWFTQSIFMRNELVDSAGAGPEMFYQDVLIENNLIINAHLHGITVGETSGLAIRNNTVVRNPGSEGPDDNPVLWTPRISVAAGARDVRIEGNVVAAISGHDGQAGWTVAGNVVVQDRTRMEPGFYERVFAGGDPADPTSFAPRPGGPLDGTGVGAALTGLLR